MSIFKKNDDILMTEEFQDTRRLKVRFTVLISCVVGIVLLLAYNLYVLQIVENDTYTARANNNQLRVITEEAKRGDIYDTNMTPLAVSRPEFSIAISTAELADVDVEQLCEDLANVIADVSLSAEAIYEMISEHTRSYEPLIIATYDYEERVELLTELEERRDDFPAVFLTTEPARYYPEGTLAGQIVGTVGKISSSETYLVSDYGYSLTDWVGKSGLEYTFERFTDEDGVEIGLRGTDGYTTVEVDSSHNPVAIQDEVEPVSGNSLVLTIDADIQLVMEETFESVIATVQETYPKSKGGAGVLIEVDTGAIIAMASYPLMDPNDFTSGLTTEMAEYYWDDTLMPTFNRAISATYAPGSTFKPITAAAIAYSGLIDPNFTVTCTASAWVNPLASCPSEHGTVNMETALAVSCNLYFQIAAEMIGIDTFYEMAYNMGLGQKTGIELPSEATGVLPNAEWKAANYTDWESSWHTYDTYYMSIGQGGNSYTPLQMAVAIATIANGGDRMQPYLVDYIFNEDGEVVYETEPEVVYSLEMTDEAQEMVYDGMVATASLGGTAYTLFKDFPFQVAAKTGTAQTGLAGDDPDNDYHGWFVAYAPADDPVVAFAGVVEYGYHGSTSAGYVCQAVFEAYFGLGDYAEDEVVEIAIVDEYGVTTIYDSATMEIIRVEEAE